MKPETARLLRLMLEGVVTPEGTGTNAMIPGYRVAGKTGTAHKARGGGYSANSYVSSFVGFAPASQPRIAIAVMINEPKGNYYGGLVAAPVFRQVMAGSLRMMSIAPDAASPLLLDSPKPRLVNAAEGDGKETEPWPQRG